MERFQSVGLLTGVIVLLLVWGCTNPFAPALRGETGSLWSDAGTVGGLLQNFATAYRLGDSLQYADLLDEQFQFQYFDYSLMRNEGWYRETDLRATSRMFHSFQNISLIWEGLDTAVTNLSAPNTPYDFRVHYQLNLDQLSSLRGFAHFTVSKPEGGRFRILLWEDEF